MSDKYEGLRRAAEDEQRMRKEGGEGNIRDNPYWNAFIAKAKSDVILSLLQERDQLLARETPEDAWKRGFIECRSQAERIVDEHDGYLSQISSLGIEELYPEPRREEGKHRFMAGTCVDCGHPLDEICSANLGVPPYSTPKGESE